MKSPYETSQSNFWKTKAGSAIRWVSFIPIAIIGAAVIGAIVNFMTGMTFIPGFLIPIIGGFVSAIVFLHLSQKVAPKNTKTLRVIISIILCLIGAMSGAGGLVSEPYTDALQGGMMLLVAIITFGKDLNKEKQD